MITYEVRLTKIGEMTTLPDSQRLFGFLINNSKKYCSEEEISAFVKGVREQKAKCMISSVFPTGYYPTPKGFIIQKLEYKLESAKNIYETIKNMDFVEQNQLKKLLKLGENREKIDAEALNKFKYIKKSQTFIQKFRLESQIKELPGIPNVAYSLPILSFTNQAGDVQKNFSFFVKVEKGSCISKCLERMKKNLDKHEIPCFLGGKGSSGYNEYQIHCIEKLTESENKEYYATDNTSYLNMGVLLPDFDKIDAENSVLDIYTSDRKPFEIENDISKIISFITAGSVIKIKEDKTDLYKVGKSIDNSRYNPLYRKNAIIFGNSYFVKLEV